jgi:hypothetical protein
MDREGSGKEQGDHHGVRHVQAADERAVGPEEIEGERDERARPCRQAPRDHVDEDPTEDPQQRGDETRNPQLLAARQPETRRRNEI